MVGKFHLLGKSSKILSMYKKWIHICVIVLMFNMNVDLANRTKLILFVILMILQTGLCICSCSYCCCSTKSVLNLLLRNLLSCIRFCPRHVLQGQSYPPPVWCSGVFDVVGLSCRTWADKQALPFLEPLGRIPALLTSTLKFWVLTSCAIHSPPSHLQRALSNSHVLGSPGRYSCIIWSEHLWPFA